MKRSPADHHLLALAATLGAVLLAFLIVPLVQLSWVSPLAILRLFTVPEVRQALILTFACAAAAASLGLIFSAALGYWLAHRPVWISRALLPLVDIPLLIPHPVAGIALLLILARPGLLNHLLQSLHLSPASGSLLGTPAAIIAAMLFVSAPYQVQVCRQAFAGLDPAYALRARTHSAQARGAPCSRSNSPSSAAACLAARPWRWHDPHRSSGPSSSSPTSPVRFRC